MERGVTRTVVREVGRQVAQWAGAPTGLLQRLPGCRLVRRLAGVDPPGGYLPAPRVGGEPVTPQQQHAAFGVVDDGAAGRRGHPQDVMVEPTMARDLDVDERQAHPLAVVDRPLPVDDPPHSAASAKASASAGWTRRLSTMSVTFRFAVTARAITLISSAA